MFRANTAVDAFLIYEGLLGAHGRGTVSAFAVPLIATLLAAVWLFPNTQELLGETSKVDERNWAILQNIRWRPSVYWWLANLVIFTLCMTYSSYGSTFLYFQF